MLIIWAGVFLFVDTQVATDKVVDGVLPPEAANIRSMELRQATQPVNTQVEDIIREYLRTSGQ